jgi:asparagine synthase (glutamine-hydrolysing)
MCGIAGIFLHQAEAQVDQGLLARMNNSQLHRGPDEGGIHTEPGLGLGHRRLSIIDLASGQQPLYNEDGSVVVVYNGEIYNFQELARELKQCGHVFRTDSDTEVIVHAWEEWGEACVQRFRGMFAFALWDRRQGKLLLVRDRLGIKPLYYAQLPGGDVVFASELKALLLVPGLSREMDEHAIEDYFAYGYIPEPKTILRQGRKLPPGHTLLLERGKGAPEPRQYWDIPFALNAQVREDEVREELIARLREAVNIRLVAEVPLGAFLSGGVDSSAVVAMMADGATEPVNTCSISFGDPRFNETQYAEQVAERYGTRHRTEQVDPDDFSLVDELAHIYDEPFADSSAIPTYRVCQLARRQVTVALSGDGGDENLAGYRRYQWHMGEERLRALLPLGIRRPLFNAMGHVYPAADWLPKPLRAKATLQALARDSLQGYYNIIAEAPDVLRGKLFSKAFRQRLGGYHASEVLREHAARCPTDHPLSRIQYLDMKTYLVGDILTKVDRASMANSLEVRVPLLDHKLMEWLSSLPPDLKLQGGEGKSIFKKALAPYLPDDILYRPKMGFAVPLAAWFRGPLRQRVQDTLLGPTLSETGLFERRTLEDIIARHQSGRRDYSAVIWALLMFEAFQRRLQRL